MKNNKSNKENRTIVDSFNDAINGIIDTVSGERNMRIHLFAAVLVIGISVLLDFTRVELIIIAGTVMSVFIFESINTSIEKLTDLATGGKYHPIAKKVKDIAAGAVLLTSINAVFIGYLLIYPKIGFLFKSASIVQKVMKNKEHLALLSVSFTLLMVLILKGIFYKPNTTHLSGGTVSGHTALAFNLATLGTILSSNKLVAIILYAIAIIVAQSRVEAKYHTLKEVILGAILGTFIGMIMYLGNII